MTRSVAALVVVILAVAAAKLGLAARWGLLADEAYHWTWSLQPALGNYDQPPVIAWLLAAVRGVSGDAPVVLRSVAVGSGVVCAAVLLPHARDRALLVLWVALLPPLCFLTTFAVPDAPLLAGWSVALSAAIVGGPLGWGVAAVAAAVAALSKYTGLLVLPLLLLGAPPDERRTPWPWVALGVWGLLLLPHALWLLGHDGITVAFQAREGLWHPNAPGPWGALVQIRDQVGVVTPLAWVAGLWWLGSEGRAVWDGTAPRAVRMAWWSSAPLVIGFAVAAVGGPPEAHWPAPAWLGIGLGLSLTARGRLATWAWSGAWLGAGVSVLLALHATSPLWPLRTDPAERLTEGAALGDAVARWVLPVGVAPHEPEVRQTLPVYTERYQEAALIQFTTGIPARTWPGCGRRSQYDLTPAPDPTGRVWWVRPATSGPPTCVEEDWRVVDGPHTLKPSDPFGRRPGPWQLFALEPR